MKRRIATIVFSRVFLLHNRGIEKDILEQIFFQLPRDSRLVGFGQHLSDMTEYMCFESQDFKETDDGQVPPNMQVMITSNGDGTHTAKVDVDSVLESPLGVQPAATSGRWFPPIATRQDLLDDLINPPAELEINEETLSIECSHSWTMYQGLNEQFEYCQVCSRKRT